MPEKNLEHIRHTLSHLLAAAVLEHWPNAQLTLGPAIENGFYYDIDFGGEKLGDEDLKTIEKTMRKLLPSWDQFSHREVTADEALKAYKDNPYKVELIQEIASKGEAITLYSVGEFTDLCRGGHSENPANDIDPDAFTLDRIAGAYWRGKESNPMLTRIYGLAFDTKEKLNEYLTMRAEAEKRDHRKLGRELGLFTFSDLVGPGLPLWLPKGTVIVDRLEDLAKETENAAGYVRVRTPHVAKEEMYKTSGHLPYYADSMFPPMKMKEGESETTYYLKAMNCPHHHQIFLAEQRSYRDLPLRVAEYGTCYRYEQSGELFGLMRVRMLSMNDAHIYCTEEQFEEEFKAVNAMYMKYFDIFNIKKYVMRFSTHDPKELGKKYVNAPELWKKTEDMVRKVLQNSGINYVEVPNEAAFYGPKIDVQVWSAIGREFTIATNQVDFSQPKSFSLQYTDAKGEKQMPLIIHRAPLGTHERFIGFLIEHFGGSFPTWLSPTQVAIIPISEDKHGTYAHEIFETIKVEGVRVDYLAGTETLGKRIRYAKEHRIPYMIIIGDKEQGSNALTIESRKGKMENVPIQTFLQQLKEEISKRTL